MVHVVEHTKLGYAVKAALTRRIGVQRVNSGEVYPRRRDMVIAAVDGWAADILERWQRVCRQSGATLLCVHVHGTEAVIGPAVVPGEPGCIRCWFSRYYSARPLAREYANRQVIAGQRTGVGLSTTVIGELAATRVARMLDPRGCALAAEAGAFYCWNLETLEGRASTFLPEPLCPECGNAPRDTAEKARISFTPRPKADRHADRVRGISALGRQARAMYLDARTGIVRAATNSRRIRYGAVALAGSPVGDGSGVEKCSGFEDNYEAAQTTAILEALERYSSSLLRARKIAIHGSRRALGDVVIDPARFGLHSESDYRANAGLLTPYSDALEMNFIWAYSFERREPVLLPYQLGFYPFFVPGDPVFVVEGSTGCASGSCVEEALLHGIFEAIERDAFLLTWYATLKQPRFDPMQCSDPEIRCRCRHLKALGFDVLALDISTEYGIPALWVMARRRRPCMPNAFAIGSAHLNPRKALRKALRELTSTVSGYTEELTDPARRDYANWLGEDASRVQTMADHALFYCPPASGRHLDFLYGSDCETSLEEIGERCRDLSSLDLAEDARGVIERIVRTGSDVIAVDQTSPEQAQAGLVTYKALIPGAIPMTWGEHFRRLTGLPRLDGALQGADGGQPRALNPAPHPFP